MNCWVFNIGIEREWTTNQFKIKNKGEDIVVQYMEEIMLLLAKKEDVLLLRKIPEKSFLLKLEELGFEIPEILCPEKQDSSLTITDLVLSDKKLLAKLKEYAKKQEMYLMPYGVTQKEERLGALCGMKVKGSTATISHKTNSKLYARELAEKLHIACPKGMVCDGIEEIQGAWEKLKKTFQRIIIKQIYGASGQGLYLVDSKQKLERVLHILKRGGSETGKWIVEGWYEDKLDLNAQLYLHENGEIDIFSIKEQLLQETVYKGSVFPAELDEEKKKRYTEEIEKVGKALYEDGVRGVVGIDSVLTESEIFPVIEINVRFTLSTYLSRLPHLFQDRFFQTIYYRIPLNEKGIYEKLEKKLIQRGLAFSTEEKEGIFFYNPACMKDEIVGNMGRLFAVMVAGKREGLQFMQTQLEKIMEEDER